MDTQRLFLTLIFAFSLALVWDGWQRHQHPERYTQQATAQTTPQTTGNSGVPTPQANLPAGTAQSAIATQATQPAVGKIIKVKTDTLEIDINTLGGDISRLMFLKHPDAQDKNKPMVFFDRGTGTHNYVAQTGLLGAGLPTHNSMFVAEQESYQLSETADKIQVRLTAQGDAPLKTIKVLTFHKNSYLIDVGYELENTGTAPVKTSSYYQLVRNSQPPSGSSFFLPTFTGVAVYTEQDKYKKVEFADINKGAGDYPKQGQDGWIAFLQHYFVAAWLPQDKTGREYFTRKLEGDNYAAGVILPEVTLTPGQKTTLNNRLYVGPAQTTLDKIAPGLDLSVDYGILTPIAKPLFWLMSLLHDLTGNWGIAIILLTVIIKLVFFPLSAASYRSMAKMRVVAPKLERIKQQYANDREQLGRAMMDLYKTEKINPLGGCLPVLVQIPVFISLYWAILSSVEIRYAPFFGWITDLSAIDPYYITPVIMGVSMFIQVRLNPVPPDPIQAKVMKIMPIAFSVFFFFFPAGLVLYSIVNNILSIAQQWYINRMIEQGSKLSVGKR